VVPGRRTELLLVGLFLALSCGAVYFVFSTLRQPGRAFESAPRPREKPAESPPPPRTAPPVTPLAPPASAPEEPLPGDEAPAPPDIEEGVPAGEDEPPPPPETAGERADLILELLAPSAAEDRIVTARVVDTGNNPIPRALVVVRDGTTILYRARTDLLGLATFEPYPEEKGPFRLDALAHGFLPAHAPSVAAGAETELVLEYRPIVEGKVRGAEGRRGIVRLFQAGEERVAELAPDGTFVFEDLDPGATTVQAEVDHYGADTESFHLEAGIRRYVSLRIRDAGAMSIRGKIEPWPGSGEVRINGLPVSVRPSGTFEFEHAIVGMNEILIDAPERALLRERFTVKTLQMSFYPFRTSSDGQIRGRVRKMFTNESVPGAEVRVGYDRGDPRNDRVPLFPIERVPVVLTDDEGRFEITRLDKRLIYLVSVVAPGFGQYLGDVVPSGGTLTVKMPEGPYLYGRLRGAGGIPREAVVTAVPLDVPAESRVFNKRGWHIARAERDRDGYYGLSGLLPGAHLVRVDAPGFGSVETVVDLHVGERIRLDLRVRQGIEVDRDAEALLRRLPPVTLELEEGAQAPDATLLRLDARRPAHVEPYEGLFVRFFEGDMEFAPPREFDLLEVELWGLPEATYRAILTHPSLTRPIVRDNIVLRRGLAVEVELR
jgi:hypothetical protein